METTTISDATNDTHNYLYAELQLDSGCQTKTPNFAILYDILQ